MSILTAELKVYQSKTINDTGTNGGRMSSNESVSNIKNTIWPDVPEAERTAGSIKYRKMHHKVENDADLVGQNGKLYLTQQSPGDDRVLLFPGTQRNTQTDITGSERLYGCGDLDADVSSSATTLDVATELAADAIFQNGDEVWIGDGTNEEFVTLSSAPSWNVNVATLTFTGTPLQNSYLAATPTKVASVIDTGDVEGSSDNYTPSTASGTYDDTGNPVTVDHIGGIEETWTLTFTDATNYGVVGDTVGSVGSGTVGSDFSPNNADFSKPFFTVPSAGWGGTWAAAETLVFQTHPASYPCWQKRIVPAGAGSLPANSTNSRLRVESE